MPAPANAGLHRYIKDLAHVRMELDALKTVERDEVVKKFELRVKAPTRSGQPGQQHMPTNWFDMVYPRYSPSILSDDYTIPSQMSVEVPAGTSNSNNNSNVRWSFLFPSAPLVVGHQAPGRVFCLGRARRRRVCQVRVRCRAPRDRPSATQPVRFLRIRFIYMSLTLAQNRVYRRNL